MVRLEEIYKSLETSKNNMEFMKTGFDRLDSDLDGGMLRKELIVIGGSTGIGKSYLAGQIMQNIARQGFKCAYFSLEVSNEMIVARMVGSIANLKPTRIQTGLLTPEEIDMKVEAKAKLSLHEKFLTFYDNTYELSDIVKEIEENDYEFVVVDFIQNVMAKGESENIRLNNVALALQRVAKDQNCCILALSQLSNMVVREGDKSQVIEYKGSGAIGMVCDLGFFIFRDQDTTGTLMQGIKLLLKKNRRGSSGMTYDLTFQVPGGYLYGI
jgi:replicative DNA helicase